jgi:hypothetical protein
MSTGGANKPPAETSPTLGVLRYLARHLSRSQLRLYHSCILGMLGQGFRDRPEKCV